VSGSDTHRVMDPARGTSPHPSLRISGSGRYVAFTLEADDLPGDAAVNDVYVRGLLP
jgi:hypothetical protein